MHTLADLIMFKSKWIGFTVFLLAQHLGAPGVGSQKAANQPAEMSEANHYYPSSRFVHFKLQNSAK